MLKIEKKNIDEEIFFLDLLLFITMSCFKNVLSYFYNLLDGKLIIHFESSIMKLYMVSNCSKIKAYRKISFFLGAHNTTS